MGNRYLVLSDLHLADFEDHPDGWMAYKSSRHDCDPDLASLFADFERREAGHGTLTLVLNGDIFDFDLVTAVPDDPPWPVSRSERRRGLDATARKSAWKLARILADHPVFVAALARFAGHGHRIVYVSGNHDGELFFPEVQAVLRDAVLAAGAAAGLALPRDPIRFEPWFYHVPGEIYVEHGEQHDYYSSFQHVLSPVVECDGEPVVALPMGNLSNRYLMSRMGFFNPHAVDFILNALRYLAHWWRHYALTRRSLVFPWFFGSLLVMAKLVRMKSRLLRAPADLAQRAARAASDNGVSPETLEALSRLQQPPIMQRFFRILREFWIDRLLIALVMTGGTVALALVPIPLWIKLMVPLSSFPLLYFIYEYLIQEEGVHAIGNGIPSVARAIGDLLPVQVVSFGHSHRPRLVPLRGGLTFADTGTWAPITKMDDRRRTPGYRNYLVVAFDGERSVVRLECWDPVRPMVRAVRGRSDRALCRAIQTAALGGDPVAAEGRERGGGDDAVACFLGFVAYRLPAGTATLREMGNGVGRIDEVVVVPERRRLGVGRALVQAVEAEARVRGLREVVVSAPVDVVPFFAALGYTEGDDGAHGAAEAVRILHKSP